MVGVGRVLGNALPPSGGPLGADAAHAIGRIMSKRDCLAELVYRLHPGHNHAVCADIQRPLDQTQIEFRHAN